MLYHILRPKAVLNISPQELVPWKLFPWLLYELVKISLLFLRHRPLSIPSSRNQAINARVEEEFSTKSKPVQPPLLSIRLLPDPITAILRLWPGGITSTDISPKCYLALFIVSHYIMLLRKLFGLSPPPISQFFQFDGRALVSRFGCSLRVYYNYVNTWISSFQSLYSLPAHSSYFMPSIRLLPYQGSSDRGLPFRYQLLSYFKMLYHGLEVSPPTSIDLPFGTHSFSYRRTSRLFCGSILREVKSI